MRVFGAAGEVTGSCTLIESAHGRVLVDFGIIQGSPGAEARNAQLPDIEPRWLDAVVLTHAHIDHCGRLPMLVRAGFDGPIYVTPPTADLLKRVLKSSARVQRLRLHEWWTRKEHAEAEAVERGVSVSEVLGELGPPPPQLYTEREVSETMERVRVAPYFRKRDLADGVELRFLDAGHIIGSASAEVTIGTAGRDRVVVVCSGDLGQSMAPPLDGPEPPDHADVVLMESTYGDRDHPREVDALEDLAAMLDQAGRRDQRVMVPTFSIGRAQQILFRLAQLSRAGRLGGLNVYLDAPMAAFACEIYARHGDRLGREAQDVLARGEAPFHFDELHYLMSRGDSKRVCRMSGGAVVIGGNGFLMGGPIMHHIESWLGRPDARVVFAGHQVEGTPSATLAAEPARFVVNGHPIDVQATIDRIEGFSGHADRNALMRWATQGRRAPGLIVLNHGEQEARALLADRLRDEGTAEVLEAEVGAEVVI
jgi:metallo-beta-lactamase family protein